MPPTPFHPQVLPFTQIALLLPQLEEWVREGESVERCCRAALFLLRVHHNRIASTKRLVPVIESLRCHAPTRCEEMRDLIGFNIAGLRHLQRELGVGSVRTVEDAAELALTGGAEMVAKKARIAKV